MTDENALSRLLALEVLVQPGAPTPTPMSHADWATLQRTPEGVPLLLRRQHEEYRAAVGTDWSADLADLASLGDSAKRHLSHYAGQSDLESLEAGPLRRSVRDLLQTHVPGPVPLAVELGCSTGPDVEALARVAQSVLAIDSYVVPLRWLARRLAGQSPRTVLRERGQNFTFGPPSETLGSVATDAVVAVCANALDPPLLPESVDVVLALNVVDSVMSPLTLLGQIDAILKPGGIAIIGSPFHWRADITPVQEQFASLYPELTGPQAVAEVMGGRSPHAPQIDWQLLETREVPWVLRDHRRCATLYDVWLAAIVKRGA